MTCPTWFVRPQIFSVLRRPCGYTSDIKLKVRRQTQSSTHVLVPQIQVAVNATTGQLGSAALLMHRFPTMIDKPPCHQLLITEFKLDRLRRLLIEVGTLEPQTFAQFEGDNAVGPRRPRAKAGSRPREQPRHGEK